MNVFVTGATGFTGSHTVPLLLEKGIGVRCLVRKTSDLSILSEFDVELVYGDLNHLESLERGLQGIDAVINIASLGFGHAPNIVHAAIARGIQRVVFISTTAIFTSLNAASKTVRLAAENTILNSALNYTILRPTMIYGNHRDRNICRLIRYLMKWPVIPIFGNGDYLQQPVYVKDVARAIVDALMAERTIRSSYDIAGAVPITFNQMIQTVCDALGREVYRIHIPARPVITTLILFEKYGLRLPLKAEQILRLNEHKRFDYSDATRDFGYRPRSFSEGVRLELKDLTFIQDQKGESQITNWRAGA